MATIDADRKGKQAKGNAFVLSIGKANPHNIMDQSTYPDYYFRITNSEHKTELKDKFKYICEDSKIKKRYTHLTEEILKKNPSICSHMITSLDARQDILVMEVPKLGKEAAIKAMEEWSQPKSRITHLVFATTTGVGVPGADSQLTRLLGLSPSVKRYMMYQQGCFAGGASLRLAKDLAENNKGARVLVVCSEMTLSLFRAPSEDQLDSLVSQAIFGDGAAAVIVGSNPVPGVENPLFELVWTTQTILPDSEGALSFNLREVGLTFHFLKDIPELIANNVENNLAEAFQKLDITDWNSIFWVAHPGRSGLLDKIELKLGLKADKLRATRHVLSEYGNMASASVLFILDEVRQKSVEDGLTTTGEGHEWGALYCFGTGVTVDIVVLRSVAI